MLLVGNWKELVANIKGGMDLDMFVVNGSKCTGDQEYEEASFLK